MFVRVSLQEVNATPVRFISDLLVEDSWSHVFMDTLAPRGFVKVREDRERERKLALCAQWILSDTSCFNWSDFVLFDLIVALKYRFM